MIAGALRELRPALCAARRHPWETAFAATILAFGLGLSATLLAFARGAYLRGLPLPDPDRIVSIQRSEPEDGHLFGQVAVDELGEWQRAQRSFAGLVGWAYGNVTLRSAVSPAHRYTVCRITADAFTVLGIRAALGRGLLGSDGAPGAPPAVVLSDRVWREQFAGDAGIVGRTVFLGKESATVVGVLAPGQRFPFQQDLWTALATYDTQVRSWTVMVAGRLKPGTSLDAARDELTALARVRSTQATVAVAPFTEAFTGELRRTAAILRWAAALVLLLAVANMSHLLLVRGLARQGEIALRAALGAPRRRLAAQALWEASLVAALGTVAGLGLAAAATAWLARAVRPLLWMYWVDVRLDATTALIAAGLGAAAAVAAAALPVWHTLRQAPAPVLQQAGRSAGGLQLGRPARALVVFQVATATALLIAGALLWRTFLAASRIDAGKHPERVLLARLFAPDADAARLLRELPRIEEALRGDPEIEAVGVASDVPGGGSKELQFAVDDSADSAGPRARFVALTAGAPDVLGVELFAGRAFAAGDDEHAAPVALVNRSFARLAFPDLPSPEQAVVGRRLRAWNQSPWHTIVGVVDDTRFGSAEAIAACVYYPWAQQPLAYATLLLRSRVPSVGLAARLPSVIARVDPDVPVTDVVGLLQNLDEAAWKRRATSRTVAALAGGSAALAMFGLYGLLAFNARNGRRDLGVRAALGADRARLFSFVCGRGVRDLVLGVALGFAGASGGARLLATELYGVQATDLPAWSTALAIVLLGGLVACAVPAWRAALVEPAEALRAA